MSNNLGGKFMEEKIKKQDQIDIQELLKGQLDEITHNFKQKWVLF